MKIHNYSNRNALILMTACLLFVSTYTVSQAASSDAQSRRVPVAGSDSVKPRHSARLIVRRIPNLGNHVIVDLYVDGVAVADIGYGRTYEGYLRPGRHVLSVLPTPHPKWTTPWQMTLDVRKGRTYSFTAMGDHSGDLILAGS